MNIGIIGYGGMGRKHADIAKQRNHSVVAICDPNYHGVNAADLATTMEISDGVVVAVPVGIRDTIASDILMWNKPILWEKPIALDPLVSNQVLSHSKLVVAENWSWSELGSNITSGSIVILNFVLQDLKYVQSWAKDVKIGGGAFVEGGSHAITWFLHRTGYKSENIQQITAAYRGDPERGVLILNYWNNPSSHLILSIDWSEKPNKYVGHNLTSVDENGEPLVLNWGEEYNGFNKEWQAFEALIIQETLSEKAQAIKEAAHGAALISDSVILS